MCVSVSVSGAQFQSDRLDSSWLTLIRLKLVHSCPIVLPWLPGSQTTGIETLALRFKSGDDTSRDWWREDERMFTRDDQQIFWKLEDVSPFFLYVNISNPHLSFTVTKYLYQTWLLSSLINGGCQTMLAVAFFFPPMFKRCQRLKACWDF